MVFTRALLSSNATRSKLKNLRGLLAPFPTPRVISVPIMALYAYEESIPVFAADAEERKSYRCLGCNQTVKVRKGRHKVPHYYHLKNSPSCRLYSKSEDHLVAQLTLQSMLPKGEAILEKPFFPIARVADVLWEPRQIVFEIQCSLLTPREMEKRILDYEKIGYKIVWILDDRLYNRRHLRPAEVEMRAQTCYFASIRRQITPLFYDQFEIFHMDYRIKKGPPLKISLQAPGVLPEKEWKKEHYPKQVLAKTSPGTLYFRGDLLYKALLAERILEIKFSMQNLRVLERYFLKKAKRETSLWRRWIRIWVVEPLGFVLFRLLERAARS